MVTRWMKRVIDIICSISALLILLPLLLLIGVLIKLETPGPVFFIQERVGKEGRLFNLYKFRSMVDGAVNLGAGLFIEDKDSRITRIGAFLRRSSLDEIPQLFNVLKGEMSLIGPRPALPYQVQRYNSIQRERLRVRPGLSGWAHVHGRNRLSWRGRIELDVWYARNWSFALDFSIFLATFTVILGGEGINDGGVADDISRIRD